MKRFIGFFVFALFSILPETLAQNNIPLPGIHKAEPSLTYEQDYKRSFSNNLKYVAEEGYQQIKIDDATSFLFDKDGRFQYIGEIRLLSNGKYFPSGEGVSRSVVTNPETGGTELRYDLGPWKRGSRHGVFLVKLPDGTYCQERWKWNRFKGVLPDEPSSDDIARIEESAVRLETMLRITDR